ncbi:hypothetical protein AX15_001325 [Amanita polypyramis BW_CC]|nr:hypothetical protein AX15_001325 [Amanita polypyramis BW_CC]
MWVWRAMIPLPVSTTSPRLRSRARLSNAGLLLLLSLLTLSLLFNVTFYVSPRAIDPLPHLLTAIPHDDTRETLTHLIIVPGHAIWTGIDPNQRLSEDQWLLEPYQKGKGRLAAFFAHISRGAELATHDEHSLLVFSGGQTKRASTTTEAESYLRLALSSKVLGNSETPKAFQIRATTENYALDSYQNLLFSIARFHEITGYFPHTITVIGYEFKRRRYVDLHRAALRWPRYRFQYIGIDAEGEESRVAQQGELENGYNPYSKDLYGCHPFLSSKRRQRNPHSRFHPYYSSNPDLDALLSWCSGDVDGSSSAIFSGSLPWDLDE